MTATQTTEHQERIVVGVDGSPSEHVVAHAPCAVVVVKSPAIAGEIRISSASSS